MARRSAWKVALFAAAACAAGVGSSAPDGSVMAAGSAGRAPIRSNAAFVHRHQNQNAPTFGRRCWRGAGRNCGAAIYGGGDPAGSDDGYRDQPPLSDMDAIRILRATPRYRTGGQQSDFPEEMRACHTAVDVLQILGRASPAFFDAGEMSSIPNLDADQLAATVEELADSVSPNVAAAALRRLSSPPFLPGPGAGRRSRRFLHRGLNASSTERRAYDGLMKRILDRLASTMERQREYLSSSAVQRGSVNATLLPQKDTWVEPPSSEAHALNWYALADLMQSLSSLCRVLGQRGQGGNIIQAHLLTNISPQEQESMVELFEGIVGYLSWDDKMASSFVRCVGPRRLVRDVIRPLASMATAREKVRSSPIINNDEDGATSPDRSGRLLASVSAYLALPHSLDKLTALDLSTTLQSFARIYGRRGDVSGKQSLAVLKRQRMLIRAFMKRLRKSSVRASDDGKGLVQAVRAVARIIGYLEEQAETVQPVSTPKVLPMSISLPGEDGNDAPAFALPLEKDTKTAVSNQITRPSDGADIPIETLREEAVIMLHTIINDIVHPSKISVRDGSKSGNIETKLQSLGLGQIADLLHAATTLDPRGLDPATVSTILRHLTLEGVLQQCRRCEDISRLLLSLQRLRVGTGMYDGSLVDGSECNGAEHADSEGIEEQCVRLLGERFFDVVAWHEENSKRPGCNAKTLTTALRSVVLMFPNNAAATTAMLDAAKMLVLEEADYDASDVEDWDSSTFLLSCNDFELSHTMFAFAMAKRFDEDVFVALTSQILEGYILESCSASSASRAMWSCAMLLSLEEDTSNKGSDFAPGGSYLQERQVDLFHQLAPQLLYSPMSPTDASCAMWAWAKMDYAIDRGIFDTLAESLAANDLLEKANTRLVSQALWACAKMVEFDSFESEGELPPYVKCVDKYIRFLVANQAQMTPKHISQTIWAIGRLHAYFALDQGSGHAHIDEMAAIVRGKAKHLNAREVANCVWGLSNYDQPECILELINHVISSPEHTASCTAQEAATLLFVLGKLNVHDREAFACLSEVLVDRMHEADSQTIANALWAHDVVGIAAPPELLSTWAQTKLGLGTAVLRDSNVMD
ncbi:hypothetical protein ACHAXT_003006 [Thalassiosira profunda]